MTGGSRLQVSSLAWFELGRRTPDSALAATGMPALVAEGNIKPAIYGAHIANEKGEGPAASARLGWVHDEEGASYCILNGLTIDADERAGIRIHMRNTGSDVSPVNNDVGVRP